MPRMPARRDQETQEVTSSPQKLPRSSQCDGDQDEAADVARRQAQVQGGSSAPTPTSGTPETAIRVTGTTTTTRKSRRPTAATRTSGGMPQVVGNGHRADRRRVGGRGQAEMVRQCAQGCPAAWACIVRVGQQRDRCLPPHPSSNIFRIFYIFSMYLMNTRPFIYSSYHIEWDRQKKPSEKL